MWTVTRNLTRLLPLMLLCMFGVHFVLHRSFSAIQIRTFSRLFWSSWQM